MSDEQALGASPSPPRSPPASTARGCGSGAPNSTLAVISRRIVSLMKEYYGKGPTHARTYHFGDVVLVLLRGGYTPVEKTLLADGYVQPVIEQREAFQKVMQPRFRRVIEEELKREVIAFMSTSHHDPDLDAELFVLAPDSSHHPDGASPGGESSVPDLDDGSDAGSDAAPERTAG